MHIRVLDLTHRSPEFDPVYDLFSADLPAESLEESSFLRNRLRVRDQGPKTEKEMLLVQEGYTLHLIALTKAGRIVGGIYGHVIAKVGADKRAVGFVTYIAVLKDQQGNGLGLMLVDELRKRLEDDSLRLTGKPLAGMVYEIEAAGKEEIKGLVRKLGGRPLSIDYYQPAVRNTTSAQPMQLWFQPLDPPILPGEQARKVVYPAEFVRSLVLNLLTMEYVGPNVSGFDPKGRPYVGFLQSLARRQEIGFLL